EMRIGGKANAASGQPFDGLFEIRRLAEEGWQTFGTSRVTLGPAALVRLAGTGIDIILNTNRTQIFEPDIFSNLGVNPLEKQVLLIKSTNHFHAGFAPIAEEIVHAAVQGCYPSNPKTAGYRKLSRPIWPISDQAFE